MFFDGTTRRVQRKYFSWSRLLAGLAMGTAVYRMMTGDRQRGHHRWLR
ncbi:MAG: hypothetical protein PHU78_10560 [Heliobacteriaceae bacterium]|nr:hypothetical protein [Heliobacteriaceae bacterium]